MTEISRFYGMIIQMFGNDHNPPHFHVIYNEFRAIIEIESGEILQGNLPSRQLNIFSNGLRFIEVSLKKILKI